VGVPVPVVRSNAQTPDARGVRPFWWWGFGLRTSSQVRDPPGNTRREVTLAAQAQDRSCLDSGSDRTRFPVAAKMALHTAGMTGGSAGSPTPVGGKLVFLK
jgi:hypothetical protein